MGKKIWIACVDDWELKGNGLGNVRDHQFTPAIKLMDIYDECKIKASFNVEVMQQLSFEKYKDQYSEINCQYSDWLKAVNIMIDRDYDIQLHIHPQWHNAIFDGSYWKLDKRWNITDYSEEEIRSFVKCTSNYLAKVLDGRQTLSSFRSGAWGVVSKTASSKSLMESLESLGIKMDISLCAGLKYNGESIQLDYENLDSPYTPYYPNYEDPRKISPYPSGLIEIPTQSVKQSIPIPIIRKVLRKLTKNKYNSPPPRQSPENLPDHIVRDPFGFATGKGREEFVFDLSANHHLITFQVMADYMIKRALQSPGDTSFLVLENHTKNLQSDIQFQKIKKFVRYIQKKWKKHIEFVTLQEMADNLSLIQPLVESHGSRYHY